MLYFDTEVHKTEVYQPGQPIALTPVGGGGTNFTPCFQWLDERGIVPQTLVFLTDLCGTPPKGAPAYPVLWASTEARRAPFGQVIQWKRLSTRFLELDLPLPLGKERWEGQHPDSGFIGQVDNFRFARHSTTIADRHTNIADPNGFL